MALNETIRKAESNIPINVVSGVMTPPLLYFEGGRPFIIPNPLNNYYKKMRAVPNPSHKHTLNNINIYSASCV
jgi:hypothetical protein